MKKNNPSYNMEVTLESSFLMAIFTIVGAATLTYLLNKKLERDRRNLKRKQIATTLYEEVSALQGRLKSLLDINSDLSVPYFQKPIPIYVVGGLFYSLQSDSLLFSKELNDNLSKLYTHILYLEDYRKRVNREYGVNPDQTRSVNQEFPLVKKIFDEAISMIKPILEMLEREKK
jgi:hypothetical protein